MIHPSLSLLQLLLCSAVLLNVSPNLSGILSGYGKIVNLFYSVHVPSCFSMLFVCVDIENFYVSLSTLLVLYFVFKYVNYHYITLFKT